MKTTNDDIPANDHNRDDDCAREPGDFFIVITGPMQCDLCDHLFLQEDGGQVTVDTVLCPQCVNKLVKMYEEDRKHRESREEGESGKDVRWF